MKMRNLQPVEAAAPTMQHDDRRAAIYTGHLPGGNPVQAHSADALYAQHGAVIFAVESETGRRLWKCLHQGHIIASHPNHNSCQLLAWARLTGA